MRTYEYIMLNLIICACCGNAKEDRQGVYERDLLMTNTSSALSSTNVQPPIFRAYVLAYESGDIRHHGTIFRVRVWDKVNKGWPGLQPQIIQVVDANSVVLSAKKVGGEPMMDDAWTAQIFNEGRLFVYIRCKLRGRFDVKGVYIYEVDDTLSIIERGIYFDKDDIAKEKKRFEADGKRFSSEYKKGNSNKVPEAISPQDGTQPQH